LALNRTIYKVGSVESCGVGTFSNPSAQHSDGEQTGYYASSPSIKTVERILVEDDVIRLVNEPGTDEEGPYRVDLVKPGQFGWIAELVTL